MNRFLASLFVGLVLGVVIGLTAGWWGPEGIAVVVVGNPASRLDQKYKEDYTVYIAGGFLADGDVTGAVERLRLLQEPNIPVYVQELAERYITHSANIEEIRYLVALSEGLGRLTPIMEPYRTITRPESQQ